MGQAYSSALQTYPLFVKSLTSGSLCATGDIICQKIEQKEEIDFVRTMRLGAFGFFISGPFLHYWYRWIEGVLPGVNTKRVLQKLAVDQTILPITLNTAFFYSVGLMEGYPINTVNQKYKRDIGETLKMNYMIWPLATVVNYAAVPIPQRVLFMSSIQLGWSVYLSSMAAKKPTTHINTTSSS